jgi:hypothetical protein
MRHTQDLGFVRRRHPVRRQPTALACLLGLLVCSTTAWADGMEMARVDQPVDIKAEPSPEAEVVARAEPGDRFPIVDRQDEWFKIQLFHDSYYLPQAAVTEVVEVARIPEDEASRKAIFRALYAAEDAALKEAERQALIEEKPALDEKTRTFLLERAKLAACRKSGISVAGCIAIAFEGPDKGWSTH